MNVDDVIGKKWLWWMVATVLLIGGCGPTAKDKLVGKWAGSVRFDDAAVQRKLEEGGNNPIKEAIVRKILEALESGTVALEFKRDGSYTLTSRLGSLSENSYGTWEVVAETAQQATIRMTDQAGKVQETALVFADTDVVSVPLTGEAAGIGEFRCTRAP
jgi:hypothetical protein